MNSEIPVTRILRVAREIQDRTMKQASDLFSDAKPALLAEGIFPTDASMLNTLSGDCSERLGKWP